ncbi:MAG: peptide chain release factor N(5)-glutamine methyltransferase [Oscillospiraceae bacterium]|nr:peptide chain release factor N(5)-glutamine methyltransferase [Oscillospiraceae bacterium]
MTIRQAITKAQTNLQPSNDARFDALLLAEHTFKLDKTQLHLQANMLVDPTHYFNLVARRAAGEPLQYILGSWEFYGLPFAVGLGVLIPRPETEMLVELALRNAQCMLNAELTIVDLCAGSGCIGLSIAHHLPHAQVHLVELSDAALPYLKQNAARYPNATVHHDDIFNYASSIAHCALVVSNPPYIATHELASLQAEVQHEPAMALDGGADGLDFYRKLAEIWLPRCDVLAVECGDGQAEDIVQLFGGGEILQDFNGIGRVVVAKREQV